MSLLSSLIFFHMSPLAFHDWRTQKSCKSSLSLHAVTYSTVSPDPPTVLISFYTYYPHSCKPVLWKKPKFTHTSHSDLMCQNNRSYYFQVKILSKLLSSLPKSHSKTQCILLSVFEIPFLLHWPRFSSPTSSKKLST